MRGFLLTLLKVVQEALEAPTDATAVPATPLPAPVAPLEIAAVPPQERFLDAVQLAERIRTFRDMLAQIDSLAGRLPTDARPLGIAARKLVEETLRACEKAPVSASRLAADMERVSALAVAMRERLLLAPRARRSTLPN